MTVACGDESNSGDGTGATGGASSGAGGTAAGAGVGGGVSGAAGSGTGGTGGASGGAAGSSGAGGSLAGSGGSSAGTAGSAAVGTGGTAGAAGSTVGAAGSGDAGTGGTGNPVACTITATHELSAQIGTVGIVTWSADLPSITSAHIEFGPDTGYGMQAPVDLAEPDYRTLLLGMKQAREYHYRIVASNSAGTCASEDYTLTTNALPNGLPGMNITGTGSPGFLHSCFFGLMGGGTRGAFILDADGDYVWYGGTGEMARAEIHPDNKHMYYSAVAAQGTGGTMRRIRLDGTGEEDLGSEFSGIHHDFTILADGTVAFIRRVGGADWVAEWKGGTTQNLINVTEMLGEGNPHANSIHYHPEDDSYTVSDRNYNAYVKSSRAGVRAWKLGGENSSFSGDVTWNVNHGHTMIGSTGILLFNNGNGGDSRALELSLDLDTMVATEVWDYSPSLASSVLGDVQILDNGNRVITFSTAGVIDEVSATDKSIVQSIEFDSGGAVGYATKRLSLYGPLPNR